VRPQHVDLLRCPETGSRLELAGDVRDDGGDEILEAILRSEEGRRYVVRNGIPRFVEVPADNRSWNFKWTQLDRGRGLNYRIIDETDAAYEIHDIFDRNAHGGRAFEHARGRLALDIGCGVGQYSVKLAQAYEPAALVSLDLTSGVDVFRGILAERYPELLPRILLVQGSALALPFADETFDFVMSLGVLMHTGRTLDAIREATRVVDDGGQLNIWIYASEPVPLEAREPERTPPKMPLQFASTAVRWSVVWGWIRLFRVLPHGLTMRILRAFSSRAWLKANRAPLLGRLASLVFPTVQDDDYDYRLINNYDGYVNSWSDTWNEHEILPVLAAGDLVPLGISDWRLGVWAVKERGFYARHGATAEGAPANSR
jgi:ubiquinone/menaquinone biosynthesis C-methylase UbiE